MSRGSLVDFYAEGDRSAVMVGETVIVLSEIATAILHEIPTGATRSLDQITASIVGSFGEPEPPDTAVGLTLQHVHDLAAHHVLTLKEEEPPGQTATAPDGDGNQALRRALRTALGGDERWHLPTAVPRQRFIEAAKRHRVVPLLHWGGDRLDLDPALRAELRAEAELHRIACGRLASDLHAALDTLDRAGVRAICFKGVALSRQAFQDESVRGFGDLDLLVDPSAVVAARRALTADRWLVHPMYPSPEDGWAWRHLMRVGNEMLFQSGRTDIDLHWYLVPARSTFPSFDVLWARRAEVEIGGRAVPTLSPYDALAHSAGHSAKDGWQTLRALADVHRLASRSDTWTAADRPLRRDQRLTLGLAARLFGVPAGSPRVVRQAAAEARSVEREMYEAQQRGEKDIGRRYPGVGLVRSVRISRRTGAGPQDVCRRLLGTAVPTNMTLDTPDQPLLGAAVVLRRRAREVAGRLKVSP